mmetsp:Transcript_1827/g.4942  ORF Transcript_1827/g.4942 Transcript_1827/m.4942 type:complete len:637 (-) Transcript_1827:490-2400(-)
MGLPHGHPSRPLRGARGPGSWHPLPPQPEPLCQRRRRLQNQGVELQAPPLHLHAPGASRLHPHRLLPPRQPMDRLGVRRPDRPHLELAEPLVPRRPHGPQPLRHVGVLPPRRGPRALRVARPDGPRVGHLLAADPRVCAVVDEHRPRDADLEHGAELDVQGRRRAVDPGHREAGARAAAGVGQRGSVRVPGWHREVRARGALEGRELGVLPSHPAAYRQWIRRSHDQAVAHVGYKVLGGRDVPGTSQQHLVRHVPPAPGHHRVQLGRQDHPLLGPPEAQLHPDLPPRQRPLLDPRRPPQNQPHRRRTRRRHGRLQACPRAPGLCRRLRRPRLRQRPRRPHPQLRQRPRRNRRVPQGPRRRRRQPLRQHDELPLRHVRRPRRRRPRPRRRPRRRRGVHAPRARHELQRAREVHPALVRHRRRHVRALPAPQGQLPGRVHDRAPPWQQRRLRLCRPQPLRLPREVHHRHPRPPQRGHQARPRDPQRRGQPLPRGVGLRARQQPREGRAARPPAEKASRRDPRRSRQVRRVERRQCARGPAREARDRAGVEAAGASGHGARDDPSQVRGVGRVGGAGVLHAEPHQVLPAQRRRGHHRDPQVSDLHHACPRARGVLPRPRREPRDHADRPHGVYFQAAAA